MRFLSCEVNQTSFVFLAVKIFRKTVYGNSKNVVNAAMAAKTCGLKVIGLTGKSACKLDKIADAVIHVLETETYKVQELHLPIYHYLCAECEREFFEE